MIKAEMHLHTKEVSGCSRVHAEQMVQAYFHHNYKLLVITDHFSSYYFDKMSGPFSEKVERYSLGYRLAKRAGERLGITVLQGIELRFTSYGQEDFLVYGITEEQMRHAQPWFEMDPLEFADIARKNDWSVLQAHPTRVGHRECDPAFIEGVEVFNGNPRHRCILAQGQQFARRSGLYGVSGSDAHEPQDIGLGGLWVQEGTTTMPQLQAQMRAQCRLIIEGKYE